MTTIHPGLMLILGTLIILLLAWIFWPKYGLLALLTRTRMTNRRVMMEDALKFLFDCEYKKSSCNLNTLAGNLNISTDKTSKLLDRLCSMGLITMKDENIRLTSTGRSYSLRVIRVHRIWEKYLADETGIAQKEWHREADYLEHQISPEAADKLAAQIGNPVFDPHGDPIPSPEGDLPKHKGQTLSTLKVGDTARIVHIEDEPHNIYEQLVVLGLYPGMQVYITDFGDERITFAADGEEYVLTPLFASSITVEPISETVPLAPKYKWLSSLKIGEKAVIAGISPNCHGQQRRRLMDLGIVPGSVISAEMKSAAGDPTAYRIMGAIIGIRKDQADYIFIEKKEDPPND